MTSSAADHAADRASSREADRTTLPAQHDHQPTTASSEPAKPSAEMDHATAPRPITLTDASAPLPSIETANIDDDTVMRDAGESQNDASSHSAQATSQSAQQPTAPSQNEHAPPATPIKRNDSQQLEATQTTIENARAGEPDATASLPPSLVQIKQEESDLTMGESQSRLRQQNADASQPVKQDAGTHQPANQPFTPYRGNGGNPNQTPNPARTLFSPAHTNGLDPTVMNMIQVLQGMQQDVTMPSVTHVTPSQMMKQPIADLADSALPHPNFGESSQQQEAQAVGELSSFAKIEFEDSTFQMTTYAVIIGRDMKAISAAKAEATKRAEYEKKCAEYERMGFPQPLPPKKFSKSYVSEEGGMLGPGSESHDSDRPAKRRKTNSIGSAAEKRPEVQETEDNTMLNRQYLGSTPGAAPVKLDSLRPDRDYVPIIPIHSPGPDFASKTKAISREHVKIAYNKKTGVFEAIPLHRNGFFHNDKHCSEGRVVLRCGSRLQIKDVPFTFIIPGIDKGKTGAEKKPVDRKKTGGKQMSFEFETSHTGAVMNDTSDDDLSSLGSESPPPLPDFGDDEEEEEEEEVQETPKAPEPVKVEPEPEKAQSSSASVPEPAEDVYMANSEDPPASQSQHPPHMALPQPQLDQMQQVPLPMPVDEDGNEFYGPQLPPKKRGPGRPPKNGHTSRREQKEIDRARRAQEEEARKTLPQPEPLEPAPKRKVGRPRKHPLPESADGAMGEKRKYKPRAPKPDGEGSDAERRAKEKKEKRARAKSPPLSLNIADFTQEQLQKPNKNYGQLLEETLDAHPEGLSLKQIYSRICKTWPWYYFYTETKGWESSVRHNLIGNEAFRKEDSTGLWFRVPGIPLDQGKKRKQSSPDRAMASSQYGYGYGYPNQHMAQQGQYAPGQMPMYQNMQYGQQQMQPAGQQMQQGMAQPGHVQQGQQMQAQQQGQQPMAQAQAGYGQQQQMQPRPQVAGQQPQQPMQQQGQPQQQQQYNPNFAPRSQMPAQGQMQPQNGQMAQPNQQAAQQGQHIAPAVNGAAQAGPVQGQAPGQPQPGAQPTQQGTPGAQQSPAPNGATPASSSNSRFVIDPRALQALVKLKNGLIGSLANARSPNSEAIVYSGLNICIGLRRQGTENKKMEDICVKGFTRVVAGFNKNGSTSASGSAGSPPAEDNESATIFEDPKVLSTLTGFIDVTSKALSSKLGKAKAEAVALSAVNRTLGFSSTSIANLMTSVSTPDAEGSSGAAPANSSEVSIEGLEQYLMKSVTGMIERMSLRVANPTT